MVSNTVIIAKKKKKKKKNEKYLLIENESKALGCCSSGSQGGRNVFGQLGLQKICHVLYLETGQKLLFWLNGALNGAPISLSWHLRDLTLIVDAS